MKSCDKLLCVYLKRFFSVFAVASCMLLMSAFALFASAEGGFERVVLANDDVIHIGSISDTSIDFAARIPLKYSLVDSGRVTSVKDQGNYGTCWAFATVAASESSMITEFDNFDNTLDLSEYHLAYYTYNRGKDPLNLISNDYLRVQSIFSNFLNEGGNIYMSTFSLARWSGLVYEDDMPYEPTSSTKAADTSLQYGKDVAHLENAYWYSFSDADELKTAIIQYGAAAMGYYCEDAYFLNGETSAYYCDVSNSATSIINHAATIVGWDDNYSRTNFGGASGRRKLPKNDGAWLVKNSYSSDYGINGYIWMSYEDCSLKDSMAAVFDYAETDNYDYNYQLDGGGSIIYYEIEDSGGMANVFKAQHDEILSAVSFYTFDANTSYTVKIYTGVTGKPTTGTYEGDAKISGKFPAAGYHTVQLPIPVTLDKGQKFSVVVTLKRPGDTVRLMTDCTMFNGGKSYNITSANKGESFLCDDGKTWEDVYNSLYQDNLRIKAFTDEGIVYPESIELDYSSLKLQVGDTESFSYEISPTNATGRVKWYSSNSSVATVNSSGTIKAVSHGFCKIYVKTIYGGQQDICSVTVSPDMVENLAVSSVNYSGYTLSWSAVSRAEKYQVYKYNTKTEKYEFVKQVTGTKYKVTGLKQGQKIRYKVRALRVIGGKNCYGPFSEGLTTCTTKAMSKSLTYSGITKNSVVLKWKSAGSVSGYRIYMKTAGGEYRIIKTTTASNYKITGLRANTKYYFKITAIVKSGVKTYGGSATNTVTVKTKA